MFLVHYNGKLYIFGGFNNIIGLHFNDLHEFDPLTSIWRRIRPRGIAEPIVRRRQCCVVIGHRMYMFGGTSPFSTTHNQNPDNENEANQMRLYDQNDLYVFDFGRGICLIFILKHFVLFLLAPTLRTLCLFDLAQRQIGAKYLPKSFHPEYQFYFQSILTRRRSVNATYF